MFSFTENTLEDFLLSRGFTNVRTSGRVLNATASFLDKDYAFIVIRSLQKVYSRKWRKYHIYRRFIEPQFKFASEIGYDVICAIMVHSNDTITISEVSEESFIPNQTYALLDPVSYWKPVVSVDRTFFYKIRDKNIKTRQYTNRKGKTRRSLNANRLFICDGIRVIMHSNCPDETIECLLREQCKRFNKYKKLEKAKKYGTIVKKFGLQKSKIIKNVISKFNKFECANFVQMKN